MYKGDIKDIKMIVYFLRHSKTEWNDEKKLNGLTDTKLSKKGINNAEEAKRYFSSIHLDKVYSSPLQRAVNTAKIVFDVNGDDILKVEEIIERDFGKLEGVHLQDITIDEIEDNAETHMKLYRRIMLFLKRVAKENDDDSVCAVVSHSSILRHIYTYISKKEYQMIDINNLGFFSAQYNERKWEIIEERFSGVIE